MFSCPRDHHTLVERKNGDRSVWCCNICGGGFAALALKKSATLDTAARREAWDRKIFCPRDNTGMHLYHSHGLALDVCPKCLGVWLDGDEIGKILGQAFAEKESKPPEPVNLAEADEMVFDLFAGGLERALLRIFLGS